jgi:hypothetical protein
MIVSVDAGDLSYKRLATLRNDALGVWRLQNDAVETN